MWQGRPASSQQLVTVPLPPSSRQSGEAAREGGREGEQTLKYKLITGGQLTQYRVKAAAALCCAAGQFWSSDISHIVGLWRREAAFVIQTCCDADEWTVKSRQMVLTALRHRGIIPGCKVPCTSSLVRGNFNRGEILFLIEKTKKEIYQEIKFLYKY